MSDLDTFTVEQLTEFIESDYIHPNDAIALARIALSAKQAEPIYQYHTGIINEEGDIDWYWMDCDKGFYSQYDHAHRRMVYTAPPANSLVVPEGWKLVPIELTAEMAQAAREAHEGESYLPYSIYRAMLAAAPEKSL
ncbi:hypothetical protein [Yersinia rohdei]|uniref:hypothetical protein n=1 Tax=Yersinia rohdei TaxID=29485 RepID=UPI0011A44A85|nr:hypothetical protein [Yersinia rohdei]